MRRAPQTAAARVPPAAAQVPWSAALCLCLPSPDWLAHRLTVQGPSEALVAFRQAAAGPGIIPWRVDFAAQEEGWFHLMAGLPRHRRSISIEGAHILAGQLRHAVQAQAAAAERASAARACPLDLHALVPVPPETLARGPDDPAALAWLWAHWGTTWPLRQVAERPVAAAARRRLPDGHAALDFAFYAADWSPWQALVRVRGRFPSLSFVLQPEYASR